ncbi:winged helix-turn-helix domain-containing protein [Antarcticimicrobium luteum]|uniref:Winged helix-turn-helix domain-containing protein n=1 Tax=Antarcticimicrobium luteum TaxID=2547397 RepID=A0A4R5V2U4_9RHOB|nr:crosslink repair DNA glycosylase YcaQ family protein [Antarcticimicrobium luteum]TDK46190.1 winged helix-turn-helix domain-containing protein [Antarcticimicrobium luteum]
MAPPRLSTSAARRLFLHRHGLGEPPAGAGKGADLLTVIRRLGFVQLDSVNTVARAHDMILFSRRPAYRPGHLTRLYETDRALFEHWTHDAAMIPMDFFPHWHLRFVRDAERLKRRWRDWQGHRFDDQFEPVLHHIRDHGPVTSADLGNDGQKRSTGWWDWHPSKTALEYLWRSGTLSIVGREGFRKVYDLTERVIDAGLLADHARPGPEQTLDWACTAALDRLGFATPGELAAFWDIVTPAEAKAWCAAAQARGEIVEVAITCADGSARRVFARPDIEEEAARLGPAPGRLRVLSPFDPALRDRARALRLFGFDYRIEIFVPAAKRKYGYYVFPLLEGERMVGRIDMKADRGRDRLHVTALWPERGVRWTGPRQARLEAELARVARLAGVAEVNFADGWLREPGSVG